jgi:hypothetical protein
MKFVNRVNGLEPIWRAFAGAENGGVRVMINAARRAPPNRRGIGIAAPYFRRMD